MPSVENIIFELADCPKAVGQAFGTVYKLTTEYEVLPFIDRWQGLDLKTFLRILREGQGEDRLVAIFMLGYAIGSEVRELLLPLLQSPLPKERWASALVLGQIKEKQALPYLVKMLTQYLPLEGEEPIPWEVRDPYDFWRMRIPSLLGKWQKPELAPSLRHAFVSLWQLVQQHLYDEDWGYFYRDELTYELGRIGAFGTLTGIQIPEYGLRLAMFYMACGFIDAKTRYGPGVDYLSLAGERDPDFEKEIALVWEQRFGLSEEERESCFRQLSSYFQWQRW